MFDPLFRRLSAESSNIEERPDGVAFLRCVAALYDARSVDYFATNIINRASGQELTCHYSNMLIRNAVSTKSVAVNIRALLGLTDSNFRWINITNSQDEPVGQLWLMALDDISSESAVFGITRKGLPPSETQRSSFDAEWSILGNYFHSHMMRVNGHDSTSTMIISARELDCLKWTASGKTAWEASVILGISERTVRFHLNSAREKLNCATTTHAVAKAVSRRMIAI